LYWLIVLIFSALSYSIREFFYSRFENLKSGAHPAFYQTDSGGSYTPFSAVENETLNPRRILRCSTASIVSENAS